VGKKQEPQGELCLEDPKKNPRKWNPRVAKLAGMVLEKLKGTK
jgi:fibrillarin-like rRNA methylase